MRFLKRALALIAAAVVAPAVTTTLAALYFDWRHGEAAARLVRDALQAPFLGAMFGFVGAAVFLSLTLLPARRWGAKKAGLALAGAAAGALHTLAGAGYLLAVNATPASYFLEKAEVVFGFAFGFALVSQAAIGGWIPALGACAAIGGACAGLAYAAVRGRRRRYAPRGTSISAAKTPN